MYQFQSPSSRRIKATHPGHLIPEFVLCAVAPSHCDNAEHDGAHDGGVGLPVGGLRVPASGGGPDVFRVAVGGFWSAIESGQKGESVIAYATLPPPPLCICVGLILCGVEGCVMFQSGGEVGCGCGARERPKSMRSSQAFPRDDNAEKFQGSTRHQPLHSHTSPSIAH